jgi:hypothetical protein
MQCNLIGKDRVALEKRTAVEDLVSDEVGIEEKEEEEEAESGDYSDSVDFMELVRKEERKSIDYEIASAAAKHIQRVRYCI